MYALAVSSRALIYSPLLDSLSFGLMVLSPDIYLLHFQLLYFTRSLFLSCIRLLDVELFFLFWMMDPLGVFLLE